MANELVNEEVENVNSEETTEETTQETTQETDVTLDDLIGKFKPEDILERPELSKLVQSRVDSTVTKALQTARGKWQAELEDNLDEAKKLEKMTKEQRDKYEFKKEKEKFEQERQTFEKQQLINATGSELLKRNLDATFAPYCIGKDAEETKANIDKFEQSFNEAVSNALNKRMKGNIPKDVGQNEAITKESIKNMTTAEINAHWDEVQNVLKAK